MEALVIDGFIHLSSGNSDMSNKTFSRQLSTFKMKCASISSSAQIGPMRNELCRQHFPNNNASGGPCGVMDWTVES